MHQTTWVLLDTETNGITPPLYAVELGAQKMRGWLPDGPPFRRLLNHNADISPQASRVNGYTREILERDGDDPRAVYRDFAAYAGDLPIVAYNLPFDWDQVLLPEWQRLGLSTIGQPGFCALELARRLLDPVPAGNCKLQTLRQFYRLPDHAAHTALGDVLTVADLMNLVLRPLAEARGLHTWDDVVAFTQSTWFPSRIAFGKYKDRLFQEAATDTELFNWLQWLAGSSNARSASMGRWYLEQLEALAQAGAAKQATVVEMPTTIPSTDLSNIFKSIEDHRKKKIEQIKFLNDLQANNRSTNQIKQEIFTNPINHPSQNLSPEKPPVYKSFSVTTENLKSPDTPSNEWNMLFVAGCITCIIFFANKLSSDQNYSSASSNRNENSGASNPLSINNNMHQNNNKYIVIATTAANIRELPNTRSKILLSLKKGERIELIASTDEFFNVRLSDGRHGYINNNLAILENDYTRLASSTPNEYIETSENQVRVKNFFQAITEIEGKINEALQRVTERDSRIYETINDIELITKPDLNVDESAGVLFSNTAKISSENKNHKEADLNILAAVIANPLNPNYCVAWGMTNYSLNNSKPVKTASYALIFLAPRTTNTWMIVGLAEAMRQDTIENNELAKGAFIFALKVSKNKNTTRKFFQDLIANSSNPRLQRIISEAMMEEMMAPLIFNP